MELVKAQHLDRYEKKVMAGIVLGVKGAMEMGDGLYHIHEGNYWLESGSKSFDTYIDNHLPISRSTAYNAMKYYRICHQPMLDDPSLQVIAPTRIIRLMRYFTEENTLELLHSAATIPNSRAFDDFVRNLKGKVATDDPHDHFWVPFLEICSICEKKRKIKP